MSTQSIFAGATITARASQWTWHLTVLGIMIVAILLLFPFEVTTAVVHWEIYPAYSHCFLIIPMSAWLVWQERARLTPMAPSLEPRALFILPLLTLVWLAGYIGAVNEVRQFTLVAMIIATMLTMLGWRIFRIIAFPALYLFFLVPFGQYLIQPLQQFTTVFTDVSLDILSVPHFTEGTVFQLPNGNFEIADACAGLRFLTAAIALGVLYVHLTYTKWRKSAAFLAASVIVAIIANGLRCVLTMALAYWLNDFTGVAENHITAGFFFNIFFIFAMFAVGLHFRDNPPSATERPMPVEIPTLSRFALPAVATALLVVIAAGPAFAYWHENRGVPLSASPLQFPRLQADWTVLPPYGVWHPVYAPPDQELNKRIVKSGNTPVDVKVFYYERLRKATSLIATMNRLWNEGWYAAEFRAVDARLGDQPVRFAETIIVSPAERRMIWSSYWIGGQFTTSGITVKLLQFKSFLSGNEGTALVAFSTPIDRSIDDVRTRLRSAVSALEDLPKQLDAAGRPREVPIASD